MSDPNEHIGFVAPLSSDLAPLFPGYEFEGLIATGGMGAVYKAVQKSLDRSVAIKILPLEFSSDAAFCAGFEAEAKAMARLNHPNLIGVYDFGEVNGMLFIIMEFVAGQSIYHSSYGIAVNPAESIRLVTAICDGLTHAHENGIIHRDIKPSNILLDLSGQPKIGDFGLARPVDWKLGAGEEIFGTPHYTAPEVVSDPNSVDHRADIFSLGVMLHELLTSKLPANDPRPASSIVRCDPRLDLIIKRATQPLPAARYSSAAQMAADLRAISASKVPKTTSNSQGPKTGPMPSKRTVKTPRKYPQVKKKSSNSSTILLLLAVVAAGAAYFYFSANPQPTAVPSLPPPLPQKNREKPIDDDTTLTPQDSPTMNQEAKPEPTLTPVEPLISPTPQEENSADSPLKEPKFDVPAFLVKARSIMSDRCKTLLSSHEVSLKTNVDELEKNSKKVFRKLENTREEAEDTFRTELQGWRTAKHQLPAALSESLSSYDGLAEIYSKALEKQLAIEQKLLADFSPHSATYILGLEKEIERRKADNDPGAVTLINEEIKLTRQDATHFFNLMVGRNPASSEPTEPTESSDP